MLEVGQHYILIDTSTDLRAQMLRFPFERIDAVIYTHAHADHIFGLDELRRFNYLQKEIIPIYAAPPTMRLLERVFSYAFNDGPLRPGIPNICGYTIEGPFRYDSVEIIPIPIWHGSDKILGFRVGPFAYCSDVNGIPEESYPLLKDLDVLVLTALRERQHPKHYSLSEAVETARTVGARKTYFTHISHILDHDRHGKQLPPGMAFAYDGLTLEI